MPRPQSCAVACPCARVAGMHDSNSNAYADSKTPHDIKSVTSPQHTGSVHVVLSHMIEAEEVTCPGPLSC
jgi:hypothetical protein